MTTVLSTHFTALVGCEVPIQQAPMGSVSTPDLAVAVADAGGVGTITSLGFPTPVLEEMLAGMAKRTNGALAVNFLTSEIDPESVAAAAAHVRIVDFFWADPDPTLVEVAHAGGALACWQIGSLEEALAAADAGCDLIAVQGVEAGGHVRGVLPLLPLLASVRDRLDLPVLAAGGIGDAAAFRAALEAGADGARVGTRFVAAAESGAHPAYKQAVVDARAGDTEITDAFAVCPLCATVPRARVLSSAIAALRRLPDENVGETILGGQHVVLAKGHGLPPGIAATGHIDAMAMYAGESAAAIHGVETVGDIIRAWTESAAGSAR
jgi:nitronate monooxygenase